MTCNTCNIVGIVSLKSELNNISSVRSEENVLYNLGFNYVSTNKNEAKDELLKRFDFSIVLYLENIITLQMLDIFQCILGIIQKYID